MRDACPCKFFKIPPPIAGAPKCGVRFFPFKIPFPIAGDYGRGKRPGYFLKSQAKSPTETENYKVTTTHSLRRDLLRGGVRAWQMFGANSYAFGGAFPSCLKTTCLFAPRGSRNFWDARVYTNDNEWPPGELANRCFACKYHASTLCTCSCKHARSILSKYRGKYFCVSISPWFHENGFLRQRFVNSTNIFYYVIKS